jgi:tetratricopeptide (TPR) repeat protein
MPVKSSARKKLSRATQRDLDTRIEFMEGIVRRDPNYVDALQLLGDHYTQRGRFNEGLKVDERLARLDPENPLVFYNLACSYSLTEQFDRAALALEKALSLGYRDFAWLAKDPGLEKTPPATGLRRNQGQNPAAEKQSPMIPIRCNTNGHKLTRMNFRKPFAGRILFV